MSQQGWREVLSTTVADGTAVTAAATETILVPDYSIPAGYLDQGRTLKYSLFGRMSSAITTPGTFTFRLRWGGAAGVVLAASGAIAPDTAAAATNVAWTMQFYMVCRSIGTSGTAMAWGMGWLNDVIATTAGLSAQMAVFPDAAAVATIDTTIAKALSPTVTNSLGTASVQCHHALLESLN